MSVVDLHRSRAADVRESMRKLDLPALFVSNITNVQWLTGFTGTNGFVVLTADGGIFATCDMIGRNGHVRWPEAAQIVHRTWRITPESYRYNHALRQVDQAYPDLDCSGEAISPLATTLIHGFDSLHDQDRKIVHRARTNAAVQ